MEFGDCRRYSRLLLIACCASALAASPALAQETGDSPPPQPALPAAVEGAKTFLPADFARFAPRNALDMLRNVPGFTIREATQERGLGTATGNVLINGQRISGKSNDVITELGQIPASNVVRIEIRDAATLDVPGLSGQVANVVAKAGGMQGQFAWRPEFRQRNTDPLLTRGEVSVSGKKGNIDYTVGLQNQSYRSGANGRTNIFNAAGERTEARYDVFTGNGENPKGSVKLAWDGPGSSIGNFNGSLQGFYYDYREKGERVGPGLADRVRLVANDEDSWSYELGGDFEFALAGGRLKLIGLAQGGHTPFAQDVRTSFADGAPDTGSRFDEIADTSERIGRAEYRWKWGRSDLQLSAEGAFNSLDNVSHFFVLRPNGEYEEIPLPGGTATVKEDRYEVMASLGRSLSPKLSIQLAAGGEYSNLRQTGPGGLSRTFWRPKGLFSAAWKASPKLDVNLKLQRRVGQLNFGDFLARVNLNNESTNAGNVELVPQQSWEADLEATRNLGRYGTTTLKLYGRLYEDVVDFIPIGAAGESIGNIDSAHAYGLESMTTFNFDPLGWKGAKLDLRGQIQETSVRDPLTGERRRISSSLMHFFDVTLRHDIPDSDWAYGMNLNHQLNALSYRLTEIGRQWEGPYWGSLYAEHKDVLGLTVRATISNVLAARSMWDRTVYLGRRTDPINFIERRDRLIGPIFSFQVRGKF
ncbi:MAG TPA: TonB-dependent receptor plug domain-containing protein [Allosphingosinicella sp.]|nr:TonB-dependent receptor plug domain-containing protein [Allosphingosinicella sp.]